MKNRQYWLALLLMLALLLSACGGAPATDGNLAEAPADEAAPAEAAEDEGEALPDEPYEAVDYTLYPAP